jgi:hypothetical protein
MCGIYETRGGLHFLCLLLVRWPDPGWVGSMDVCSSLILSLFFCVSWTSGVLQAYPFLCFKHYHGFIRCSNIFESAHRCISWGLYSCVLFLIWDKYNSMYSNFVFFLIYCVSMFCDFFTSFYLCKPLCNKQTMRDWNWMGCITFWYMLKMLNYWEKIYILYIKTQKPCLSVIRRQSWK